MRRWLLLILVATGLTRGAAEPWGDEPSRSINVGYRTRELLRGTRLAGQGMAAEVDISSGGWRASVRAAVPFESADPHSVALAGAYRRVVGETAWVEPGLVHRTYESTSAFQRRHSTEAAVAFGTTSARGLTSSFRIARDVRLRANLAEARLGGSLALTKLGAFLDWSAYAGLVDAKDVQPDRAGARIGDSYAYAGFAAEVPYRIGERTHAVLNGEISGSRGASRFWSPRREDERVQVSFGIGLRVDF